MLWVLRKVFGVIALAWVVWLLLFWVSCFVSPKTAGTAYIVTVFVSFIGVPASIIWAVLKTISVLGTRRVEQPAPAPALYVPSPVSTSSVLGHTTPAVLPQAKRSEPPRQVSTSGILGLSTPSASTQAKHAEPPNSASPDKPDVYTYTAPGMPMCPQCKQLPTIFYCTTHQTAVCLECVVKHDEREECVYVPAYRAPKPL